jgi:hypothetical protein
MLYLVTGEAGCGETALSEEFRADVHPVRGVSLKGR